MGNDFLVQFVICDADPESPMNLVCLITVVYGSVVHASVANNTARDTDPNKVYLTHLTCDSQFVCKAREYNVE